MPYKFICSKCSTEKVIREEKIYPGRSEESVVEELKQRHTRKHNQDHITILEGNWDDWKKQFIKS